MLFDLRNEELPESLCSDARWSLEIVKNSVAICEQFLVVYMLYISLPVFSPLSRHSEFEDVEIAKIFKLPVLIEKKERERALFFV